MKISLNNIVYILYALTKNYVVYVNKSSVCLSAEKPITKQISEIHCIPCYSKNYNLTFRFVKI